MQRVSVVRIIVISESVIPRARRLAIKNTEFNVIVHITPYAAGKGICLATMDELPGRQLSMTMPRKR